jgi:hypothetical protein
MSGWVAGQCGAGSCCLAGFRVLLVLLNFFDDTFCSWKLESARIGCDKRCLNASYYCRVDSICDT